MAGVIVLLLGVVSFAINLTGAVSGAMCCPDGSNALRNQLTRLAQGEGPHFPLAPWLIVPFLICAALFVWTVHSLAAVLRRTNNARTHLTR